MTHISGRNCSLRARVLAAVLIAAMAVRADSADVAALDVKRDRFACYTASLLARDIVPATDGKTVWVATDGGLLEYSAEGLLLKKYTRADGLGGNNLRELALGPGGVLWIASTRGVSELDKGVIGHFRTEQGLNDNCVSSLAVSDGEIFAGTLRGVNRFDGRKFLPMDDTHEFCRRPVVCMLAAADGSLWIARDNSLSHFLGNGKWEIFQKDILRPGRKSDLGSNSMLALAMDGRNRLWLGTKMGLSVFDGDSWTRILYKERFADEDGLRDNRIQALAIDGEGFTWIGHGDSKDFDKSLGITYVRGNEWHHLSMSDGLLSDRVYRIRTDGTNTKWFATAEGAQKWINGPVTTYRSAGEIPGNHVTGIRSISNGVIVVETPAGVAMFEKGKPASAPVVAPAEPDRSITLNASDAEGIEELGPVVSARDELGRTWVGTVSEGLFLRDKNGWKRTLLNGQLFPDGITALCLESKSVLWVGTASEGAIRLLIPATD